jgi:hypothetical protein
MSGLELMDRLIAAHNQHDGEALAACYAPGATLHMDGWVEPVDVPTWIMVMDALRQSFPDLVLGRGSAASGDGVTMAEVRMAGTNTGPLHPSTADRLILHTDAEALPPTGRVMDVVGVVVLEHTTGQVTAERHYWPAVAGLVQLGLVTLGEPAELSTRVSD